MFVIPKLFELGCCDWTSSFCLLKFFLNLLVSELRNKEQGTGNRYLRKAKQFPLPSPLLEAIAT
jgi:hypothetical protein